MNPMPRLRKLTAMIFRRSVYRLFMLGAGRLPWYREVGDVLNSSVVAVTIMWCARNFPEAPPALWADDLETGQSEQVRNHPMLRLLRKPNEYYGGVLLWMATVTDWKADGNAYWIKVRDAGGQVRELWYTPSWLICPKGSEREYITHYEYKPDGASEPVNLPSSEVVHFRFGIDPDEPLKGMSPLKCVLREVFTDDEAATFTATILKNMGVPGLLVSPEQGVELDKTEAEQTKKDLQSKFTGDQRGEPIVMTGATKIQQFGFSPEQLMLRELRRIPEERTTAAIGVPAVVVGLGAGLDRSTFTNMNSAREAAYENGLIPDQRIMSDVVQWQLLPDFEDDPFVWTFGFDLSKVRVLQEDLYRLAQRLDLLVRGGSVMVAELRRGLGLEVDEQRDNIFLRPANVVQVDAATGKATPLAPRHTTNGNGGSVGLEAEDVASAVIAAIERRELVAGNGGGP